MRISGAQAMVRALELEGVTTVFGYPGAAICPFYDALLDSPIHHVLTRHEQGAAHAASGYARAGHTTGVCIATSGPGATNLITGIATAYMDSIPMVAITGQVASDLIGSDSFQEADITGATSPFTKHNYLINSAEELPRVFREAFYLAASGRPGPVLIDVPVDIQSEMLEFVRPESVELPGYQPKLKPDPEQMLDLRKLLVESQRPVVCAGGGVISAGASEPLQQLIDKWQIPVITTMMGIGSVPADHPRYLGTMGSHGVFAANFALHHADCLILLGARVGNRAMGSATAIARRAKVVHIDIDPAELGKNIRPHLAINADLRQVIAELLTEKPAADWQDWLTETDRLRTQQRTRWPCAVMSDHTISPPHLLEQLGSKAPADTILTTEVGQNQIWAANHYPTRQAGTFISSGGMGTMGYGLPAALGAQCACPERQVISISGDGSLQMSLQELGTIHQQRLPVRIILFNNSRLGMVHEIQSLKYNQRYSQVFLEENPDFSLLAAAYGFQYEQISQNGQIDSALDHLLTAEGPFFLECVVDPHEPTLYPIAKEETP
ncbi:MAG: biosynthetic-type acetolactate synthase large subunit [Eubacteriales bacterium]|nr:biosynthetic-type acetolactate synthase large subunit [Eubacteriales bacterium]